MNLLLKWIALFYVKIILFFLNITILGWPFVIILLLVFWILFFVDSKESKLELEDVTTTPLKSKSAFPKKYFKRKYSYEGHFKKINFEQYLDDLIKQYLDKFKKLLELYEFLNVVKFQHVTWFMEELKIIALYFYSKFIKLWIVYNIILMLLTIFFDKFLNPNSMEFIVYHTKNIRSSLLYPPKTFSKSFWINILKWCLFDIIEFSSKFFKNLLFVWKHSRPPALSYQNIIVSDIQFLYFFLCYIKKERRRVKKKNFIIAKELEALHFNWLETFQPRSFYDPFIGTNKIKIVTFNIMLFILVYFFLLYLPILQIYKYPDIVFFEQWKEIFLIHNWDLTVSLDGLSILFILLTAFIFPLLYITFISSKGLKNKYVNIYIKELSIIFISIQSLLLLAFMTTNFFFFFFFFECSLILFIILLNTWGGKERKFHAAWYLLFFTLLGSVLLLTAILIISSIYKTCDIMITAKEVLPLETQKILWICFFVGFAVKIPILPFHIWLPEAHVEAPTAGSIVLAALTLKVGSFGILRFALPLVKDAVQDLFVWTASLCLISAILAAFIAFFQTDLKKIIAYSSISHMNYAVLSLTVNDTSALISGINYMIAHAFSSTALFFCIGMIYDKTNTRELLKLNNLILFNPLLAGFFFLFNIVNIGFPFTYSFFAEITILIKLVQINLFLFLLMSLTVLINIFYTFWFLHNVLYQMSKNKIRWEIIFNYATTLEIFVLFVLLSFNIYFSFCSNHLVDGFLYIIHTQLQQN